MKMFRTIIGVAAIGAGAAIGVMTLAEKIKKDTEFREKVANTADNVSANIVKAGSKVNQLSDIVREKAKENTDENISNITNKVADTMATTGKLIQEGANKYGPRVSTKIRNFDDKPNVDTDVEPEENDDRCEDTPKDTSEVTSEDAPDIAETTEDSVESNDIKEDK